MDVREKIIYCIENKINGKRYVGCTFDLSKRKYAHKVKASTGAFKGKNKLYPDIVKYGIENFDFLILEKCSEKSSPEIEKKWILKLRTNEIGYNCSDHGRCGAGHWFGKKRPDISAMRKGKLHLIQKAIDSTKKQVMCVETGIEFKSITEAAYSINRTPSALAYALRKETKCAGLTFKYINRRI